jgi:hypothetical protein
MLKYTNITQNTYIQSWMVMEFLATDTEVPGSIPGATRFSE